MPAKTLRLSEAEWSLLREGMKWQSDPTSELDYTDEWRVLARKVAYQATFEPLHPDEPKGRVKPKRAQGGLVATGAPFAKEAGEVFIPYGENGPEPMVPRVAQAQPHAVRQNDLVAALRKVARAFPPHTETHHVLSLLARELVDPKATSGYAYGRPVTPEQFEQAKGAEPEAAAGSDWCGEIAEGYTCRLQPGHVGRDQKFHRAYNGKTIADSSEVHAWTDEHQ